MERVGLELFELIVRELVPLDGYMEDSEYCTVKYLSIYEVKMEPILVGRETRQ